MPRISPSKIEHSALQHRVSVLERLLTVTSLGNGWYSQPLPDGKVHVWKEITTAFSGNWAQWGAVYERAIASGVSWPFAFTATPEWWVTPSGAGASILSYEYAGSPGPTQSGNVYITKPSAFSGTGSYTFFLHAVGTPYQEEASPV